MTTRIEYFGTLQVHQPVRPRPANQTPGEHQMSERDELRGTLSNTICNASFYPARAQPHLLGGDMGEVLDRTADGLLAAGYRKPRTVTTRDEVLALHEGAVLLDSAGDVSQLRGGLWCGYEASPMSPSRQAKYIPATVLHEGEDRS